MEHGSLVQQPVATVVAAAPPPSTGTRHQIRYLNDAASAVFPLGRGFELESGSKFVDISANFADVFTLNGIVISSPLPLPGDQVEIDLIWKVGTAMPAMPAPTRGRPLSAFVHLVVPGEKDILAQYDGWPTALRGLRSSDIIRHRLDLTLDSELSPGSYQLNIGLYSPQDGARYTVSSLGPSIDHIEVPLVIGDKE